MAWQQNNDDKLENRESFYTTIKNNEKREQLFRGIFFCKWDSICERR